MFGNDVARLRPFQNPAKSTALAVGLSFGIVTLLAVVLGSPGLTDEAAVSLYGDMPKYLMNGAYMLDLMRDWPFQDIDTLLQYTRHYFARYPALSLGHHPPLLSLMEVPMFALVGVSVVSARLVAFASFLAAVAGLYLLVKRLYGKLAATFAAVFFASSPIVVLLGQSVLSETPALALIIWSAYFLHVFCVTERRWAIAAFLAAAALSLCAKQLSVFVFPAYIAAVIAAFGFGRLLRPDVLIAAAAAGVIILPLTLMTLLLSPSNVTGVLIALQQPDRSLGSALWSALRAQFTVPVVLVIGAGVVRTILLRDRKAILLLVWAASTALGLVLVGQYDPPRHGVYWVPALCVLAATCVTGWRSRIVTGAVTAALLLAAGTQVAAASRVAPVGAAGYEEAARFVLASDPGATVMFSGDIDTGFFTFFVRKHDARRALIVLRADKVLTTSFMDQPSVADRISSPEEIYSTLHRFGTRYVVIEDRSSKSKVLEWLRQELRSERFTERWRVPIGTSDPRLRGTSLVVYELLDARPPDPDAVLSMDLPIIHDSVTVRLGDLIDRKYLR